MNTKKLLLGNEAVARGLYEAGCTYVSSYPGTPSTEITEYATKYDEIYAEWATNEKVAVETAFGASVAGARAFSAMKHVGLNVAADPLFTSSYTGVNGGFVLAVADDPGMHSSQNEQDSRHYAKAAKLLMLEPSDSEECKEFTKIAFELSEKFDTPVLLRLCTRVSHSQSIVELKDRIEVPVKDYVKNPAKYIMNPAGATKRHPIVEQRQKDIAKYLETSSINKTELNSSDTGIITSGASYLYAKEVFGDTVSYLKLGAVNPLPANLLKDFASKFKRIIIIEELDGIIEEYCKSIGIECDGKNLLPNIGEFSQELIAEKLLDKKNEFVSFDDNVPVRPPVMCPGCPHRGIFYTLKSLNYTVLGDIGCYTLGGAAPLTALDTTICMGASVSMLHGFNKVRPENASKTVAVIGDSTFMHSGITGLIDIAYNRSISTVLVLDNHITGMTGHQQNPCTGYTLKNVPVEPVDIEKICSAAGIKRIRTIDPNDLKECKKVLKEETEASEPSVVIVRRPCALLKKVVKKPSLTIDTEKCKKCKACMKIGCPAISFNGERVEIDKTLCVGCDLCKGLCAFDAIK
ncbi:MAG: indolepyruvate ferredoxin oxidoreductase subunit alpha [Ruminococcaceae bacterium]|nr:indolepyruvate ferredoxin oxidoreductase subunit alpha [Oscillospiraceae bacterium]